MTSINRACENQLFREVIPLQALSSALSSLTALAAVVNADHGERLGSRRDHSNIRLLRTEIERSMAAYWSRYQDSSRRVNQDFRTTQARVTGRGLIRKEGVALVDWEHRWAVCAGWIDAIQQQGGAPGADRTIKAAFVDAVSSLNQIALINEQLGHTEVDDANAVSGISKKIALALSLLAILSIVAVVAGQQIDIVRPLKLLIGAVDRARQGDLTSRVAFDARDELGRLAATFNELMTGLQDAQQRLTSQNLALQGVATAMNHLITGADYENSIVSAISALGLSVGVDRVYIAENQSHSSGCEMVPLMRFEWTREGVEPRLFNNCSRQSLCGAFQMTRWYEAAAEGRLACGVLHRLAAPGEDNSLSNERLSGIGAPINIDNCFWGCIGFDDGRVDREWSEAEEAILVAMAASMGEILKRQRLFSALQTSQNRYRTLCESSAVGIWQVTPDAYTIYANPTMCSILGVDDETELQGRTHYSFFSAESQAVMAAHHARRSDGVASSYEVEVVPKRGGKRSLVVSGAPLFGPDGLVHSFIGTFTDITQRKQAEDQLVHDAVHDNLTGLPNRACIMKRLDYVIERSQREPGYRAAVLFLDFDHFKIINDSLGHLAGDELLTTLARRLEAALRSGDMVARQGGDEFCILLDDVKDINSACVAAQRIQKQLREPVMLGVHEVFPTVSIGIAMSNPSYQSSQDLLRDADTAMYRAKSLGRSRHEIFDTGMHAQVTRRLQLESELRQALDLNEFRLYFQPIISLKSGRIVGFEALIRWWRPQRGLCLPGEFIPVAEETGLIVHLDRWVLREACSQLRRWQERATDGYAHFVSVNLSGRNFSHTDLVEQVEEALRDAQLDPGWLRLEITESAIIENAERAAVMLSRIRLLGVRLSIDDFGTGYSSLSYLHQFPVDTLKIDRSFVSRMGADGKNSELVGAIIALAHSLKIGVVAEGIETAEQMALLKAMGCESGQGYLFSPPVDAQSAFTFLMSSKTPLKRAPLELVG